MSAEIDMITQGEDLPELLEWLAKVLRTHSKQRWSLQLKLRVAKDKDP